MKVEACYHCGTKSSSSVYYDEKPFCCSGCVAVYEILKENKLFTYYELENAPGIRNIDNRQIARYDYLEQEDIKRSVLDFYDGKIAKIRLYIPSIHCSSCIWLLENLHKLNKGILNSAVNFTKKEVSISFNEENISISKLMALLSSLHYEPIISQRKDRSKKKSNQQLLIKLGISGFAFGNVMLLSFPDYVSNNIAINQQFIQYFGYLSILLALPVLVYSASDYFLSAWKNLLKKVISIDLPIAIGVSAIFFRSVFEIVSHSGTGYLDSLTGLIFFLLIGKWYQDKTYRALNFESDYTSYFPLGITRIKNNAEEIVPIEQLRSGDRIIVHNNEIVPADAFPESETCSIDYSFITGESIPVKKSKSDRIYAGGRLIGSSITLLVEKEVETSYLAQLWKERENNDSADSFISETLNKVSRYFTLSVLLIGLVTFIVWLYVDASRALFAFTSVLIVACPCALALSVPFTFGHTQRILGRNHFYLRHSSVVEKLAKVNTIVFDKTGTLTKSDDFNVSMNSSGDITNYSSEIKSVVKHSFHPFSRAIYNSLQESGEREIEDFREVPGYGLEAKIGKMLIRIGSHEFMNANDEFSDDSSSKVYVSVDHDIKGFFELKNHYREDWQKLINSISRSYSFHLLSGDNESERKTIARVLGSEKNLHFNQSPRDKLEYIRELNKKGSKVLMIGDGLNDAGALIEAYTGISVAEDIYQFSPSSDAIIKADSIAYLNRFLDFTKNSGKVLAISFTISFIYNVAGIFFAAAGKLSPLIAAVLMPLSSVSIVFISSILTAFFGKRRGL